MHLMAAMRSQNSDFLGTRRPPGRIYFLASVGFLAAFAVMQLSHHVYVSFALLMLNKNKALI